MFRVTHLTRPLPRGLAPKQLPEPARGGLAVVIAALGILTLGTTGRALLDVQLPKTVAETAAPESIVETSGAYLTTSDGWFDQLNNPSAWRGGKFRGRQRATSRDEERREREQEEREEREERARAEREAREERLRAEHEALEERLLNARELGRERGTYRTVCVRLCDGYFFPISFATTPDRFAADEAQCNARCATGARLYVYPNPGGEPEDMRDVRGQPYTALKTAFLFRTSYVEACTCKPQPWDEASLARHRAYNERAQKSRPQVAAKVLPPPRETTAQRTLMPARENRGPRPITVAGAAPAARAEAPPRIQSSPLRAASVRPLVGDSAPAPREAAPQKPAAASLASIPVGIGSGTAPTPPATITEAKPQLAAAPPAEPHAQSDVVPQRPDGAMGLGAPEIQAETQPAPQPPAGKSRKRTAEKEPRRERAPREATRSGGGTSRPDWAARAFAGNN